MEFGDFDFGDEDDPEEVSVVFEKDEAVAELTEFEGGGSEAGVEFEGHVVKYH